MVEIGTTIEGIDEDPRRQVDGHGVDGEVATGQIIVDLGGVPNVRFPGVLDVHLTAVGCDLVGTTIVGGADGAEAGTLGPHRIGPGTDDLDHFFRDGIGRAVDIGHVEVAAQDEVPDETTDHVEATARFVEPARERRQQLDDLLGGGGGHRHPPRPW